MEKAFCTTVIVAAGSGLRMGGPVKKQFRLLGGKPVLAHTLAAAEAAEAVDAVVLVLGAGETFPVGDFPKVRAVVTGGATRTDSVRAGLLALPPETEVVLIHDGVRPLASPALFARVAELALEKGACIPVLPVADTMKAVDEAGRVRQTLRRDELVRVQTPQGFRRAVIEAAYARAGQGATDDAALVEVAGFPVWTVAGEESNEKLTTPRDLQLARWLWEEGGRE